MQNPMVDGYRERICRTDEAWKPTQPIHITYRRKDEHDGEERFKSPRSQTAPNWCF
jgi:hypothetical protein